MTAKKWKLLEGMRASKANWKPRDLKRLVTGFGFHVRKGGNHDIFIHPIHGLMGTIPRHTTVDKAYVDDAVKKVDMLLALEQETDNENRPEEQS